MILVIGGGSIGKRHIRNLVDCGIRELAVVDPRAERTEEAKRSAQEALEAIPPERRGKEPLRVEAVPTSEAAYAGRLAFEAVVVAAPPRFHSEAIRQATQARAHIFTEKPLATDDESWEGLKKTVEAAEAAGLIGMVGYNYRFYSQLQQVRRMIQEGAVGRVLSVRGTFSQYLPDWHPWEGLNFFMSSKALGGGVLLEETHLVDICRWLFGEIRAVQGVNSTISSLKEEKGFDVDDLAEMILEFESGAVGSIHMDLFGKYHQKELEVIGEAATLFWQYDGSDIESNGIQLWKGKRVRLGPDYTRRLPERIVPSDWQPRNAMYRDEIQYFLDSIQANRHLRDDVPDLRDGLQTMAVVRAARLASRTRHLEEVESVFTSQVTHGSV